MVLPKTDPPETRLGRAMMTAAARTALASSMMRRPAWPARTFSQWPERPAARVKSQAVNTGVKPLRAA